MATRMMFGSVVAAVALALGAVTSAMAGPVTINFSADASGAKPNGFSPVGHPGVKFSDSIGEELDITDYGNQSDGQGLAVNGDDPSKLVIAFDFLVDYIRIEFGNDDPDPNITQPGDTAQLQLFNGATLVGTDVEILNLDDKLNQFVEFAGGPFDRAEFYYGNANGAPINLIEVVDNITYNRVGQVPEPVALALMALGMAGLPRRRAVA